MERPQRHPVRPPDPGPIAADFFRPLPEALLPESAVLPSQPFRPVPACPPPSALPPITTEEGQLRRRLLAFSAMRPADDSPIVDLSGSVGDEWQRLGNTNVVVRQILTPPDNDDFSLIYADWRPPATEGSGASGDAWPEHRHEQQETLIVLSGEVFVTLEGCSAEEVRLVAGQTFRIAARVAHSKRVEGPAEFIMWFHPPLPPV